MLSTPQRRDGSGSRTRISHHLHPFGGIEMTFSSLRHASVAVLLYFHFIHYSFSTPSSLFPTHHHRGCCCSCCCRVVQVIIAPPQGIAVAATAAVHCTHRSRARGSHHTMVVVPWVILQFLIPHLLSSLPSSVHASIHHVFLLFALLFDHTRPVAPPPAAAAAASPPSLLRTTAAATTVAATAPGPNRPPPLPLLSMVWVMRRLRSSSRLLLTVMMVTVNAGQMVCLGKGGRLGLGLAVGGVGVGCGHHPGSCVYGRVSRRTGRGRRKLLLLTTTIHGMLLLLLLLLLNPRSPASTPTSISPRPLQRRRWPRRVVAGGTRD